MAHHTLRSGYDDLVTRLNRFPQGAPPSNLLYRILKMLFTEEEAARVALVPIRPFTAKEAAGRWKTGEAEARRILEGLCSRGMMVDIPGDGDPVYCLPPPMAGFFEFSMMRVGARPDQAVLAELFEEYITKGDEFMLSLFTEGTTQLGRTFVQEPMLPDFDPVTGEALHVLDYERATEVIRSAHTIGIGDCYCRHKKMHLGEACDAPLNICMTFNTSAHSLTKHGLARKVDAAECLDLLDQAYDFGLVQFGENVREGVNFICNCCGCCCEAMLAQRRFGLLHPVHTTNFLPEVLDSCNGCGKCVEACPVEAMTLVSANDPQQAKRKKARVDTEICLGCGVCVRACPQDSLALAKREKRVLTPLNTTHRSVMMAVERGCLQNLIWDNRLLFSHRALAAVFGVLLRLPPLKRAMASEQLGSRFFEYLIRRMKL